MGATLEWDCIPFTFTTPQGDLLFNTPDALGAGLGGFYLLRRGACTMGAPLRTSIDDVPAEDGSVVHKVLTAGYRVNLAVELWKTPGVTGQAGIAAMGETLVAMNDLLLRHLNRIRDDGGGRLSWNPSGDTNVERMVNDLFWFGDVGDEDDDLLWTVTFELVSPFPYAMGAAETTTSISDGASAVLANVGSSRFKPVIKAYGPTSEFTITNETSGKQMHYDASQPGASAIGGSGAYAEFDHFRNTAYLNGDVASLAAGVDPFVSEFFPLEIGDNTISVDGCDIDVLWQPAWA